MRNPDYEVVAKALGTMHFVLDCHMTQEDTDRVMQRLNVGANLPNLQEAVHYLAMLVFDLYRKLEYCQRSTHHFKDDADEELLRDAGRDICASRELGTYGAKAEFLHRRINELFSEECDERLRELGGCPG